MGIRRTLPYHGRKVTPGAGPHPLNPLSRAARTPRLGEGTWRAHGDLTSLYALQGRAGGFAARIANVPASGGRAAPVKEAFSDVD